MKSKIIPEIMRPDIWQRALTDQEQRLEWMRAANEAWIKERESPKFHRELETTFLSYLNDNSKTEIWKKLRETEKPWSLVITAYLLTHGYDYEPSRKYFNDYMGSFFKKHKTEIVQEKLANIKEYKILAELEELDDRKFEKGSSDFSNLLAEPISASELNKIKATFAGRLEEFQLAVAGTDEQVNEAYEIYSAKQKKRAIKWYKSLMEMLENRSKKEAGRVIPATNGNAPRPARKRRPETPAKLARHMKPLQSDDKIGLVSVDAKSIVGAKAVVGFNVRYNTLHYWVADEKLSISRTSITGYNEEESWKKRLRKPKEQLTDLLSGTRLYFQKSAAGIKTKSSPTNARVGKDMILLRVYGK